MKQVKILSRLLRDSYQIDRLFVLSLIADILLNMLQTFLVLYGVRQVTHLFEGTADKAVLLTVGLAYIVLSMIKEKMHWVLHYRARAYTAHMEESLIRKTMALPYAQLETPEFLDLQERAKFSLRNQACLENLLESFLKSLENFAVILSTFFVLFFLSPLLSLFLVGISYLIYHIKMRFAENEARFYDDLAPINRRYWYYSLMPLEKDDVLDIKVNRLEKRMDAGFRTVIAQTAKRFSLYFTQQKKEEVSTGALSTLGFFAIVLTMVTRYRRQMMGIGQFNFALAAALQFSTNLNALLVNLVDIVRYAHYTKPILDFLDQKVPEKAEEDTFVRPEFSEDLVARHLHFSYPTEKGHSEIIKGVSFNVSSGSLVVVVGENGSGKTTLMKLISGLYEAQSGEILYHGRRTGEQKNAVSAVFQDYQLIDDITLRENITGTKGPDEAADQKIQTLLNQLGWTWTYSLDDRLGVELDASYRELSKGQTQQVAVVRALFQNAPIMIFDEPAASLDVEKEKELYDTIQSIQNGAIRFLVSHRMSCVHQADEVWFIQDGQIIASGPHREIVQQCSAYRDLYRAQMDKYQWTEDKDR